jgi:oxygen-dependent protoporphyrinogen oxidase
MTTPEVGAVVVGGGIAGLAAALALQETTPEVLVIDASDRPGGVMRTDHVSGYVVERGPNTIQVKAPLLALLRHHFLEDELVKARPASRRRFVFRDGRLAPVPMSPAAFLTSGLLSLRGKARLLAEPLIRRGDGSLESVEEFAGRRLGREAVTGLIAPFLTGVYAGDERQLGAAAVFPTLVETERPHRSLAIGLAAQALGRRGERGLPGSHSAVEGLGPFARTLSERLVEPPALRSQVTEVRRENGAWRVAMTGPGGDQELRARWVVVATDATSAAGMLRAECPRIADLLEKIVYAPIVGVPLGVDPADVSTVIEGFGFLVPREAQLSLLGCLFMSQLFPGRAPADRELLQCLVGGVRWPEALDQDDDALLARVCEDLDCTLGLSGEARSLGLVRWPRAIPQPDRRHRVRIAEIRQQLAGLPGLSLAGAYLDGVSVSDALASGLRGAEDSQAS